MFRSKQCVFIGYSAQLKGVKCFDVSTGRVYISRDVVFDETKFPFSDLHPNAGALLRQEILLLPSHLTGADPRGNNCDDTILTDPHNHNLAEFCGETGQENGEEIVQNGEEITLNRQYFMCPAPGSISPSGSSPLQTAAQSSAGSVPQQGTCASGLVPVGSSDHAGAPGDKRASSGGPASATRASPVRQAADTGPR